jgi:hypothetical protein
MNKKLTATLMTALVALTVTTITGQAANAKGNDNNPWTLYQKNLNYMQKQANNAYRNQYQYYNNNNYNPYPYNPYNPYPYNPYVYNPYNGNVPYYYNAPVVAPGGWY